MKYKHFITIAKTLLMYSDTPKMKISTRAKEMMNSHEGENEECNGYTMYNCYKMYTPWLYNNGQEVIGQ